MIEIPVLYIPSFYGDIRLEVDQTDKTITKLVAEKLNSTEKLALAELTKLAHKKEWIGKRTFLEAGTHMLQAPIVKVQKALIKLMKPGRETVTVVKFASGKMEEIHEAALPLVPDAVAQAGAGPYTGTTAAAASAATASALNKTEKKDKAEAGVAVAKPTLGCPEPDFVKAELKARKVLEVFLTDEQLEDFREHNRFLSIGASGTRYMVTSRHNRDDLAQYHRTLFDLDQQRALCVHDYSVPAAEEMLGLHVLLQLPDHERYLRHLETA